MPSSDLIKCHCLCPAVEFLLIPKPKKKKLTPAKIQPVFNRWIRQRDSRDGWFVCISCQKTLPISQQNAGHYIAAGSCSFLRFNEFNVSGQCISCNKYKHGNLIDYRINLIAKIGLDAVEFLESNRHTLKKWTQAELQEIKDKYQCA